MSYDDKSVNDDIGRRARAARAARERSADLASDRNNTLKGSPAERRTKANAIEREKTALRNSQHLRSTHRAFDDLDKNFIKN